MLCLTSYKWSERWVLGAAPCIQSSRAAGLNAPGRGLAGKAVSPWARSGGGGGGVQPHSVNPAHKSSWGGIREERPVQTHRKSSRERGKPSPLVWMKFFKNQIFNKLFSTQAFKTMCCHKMSTKGIWSLLCRAVCFTRTVSIPPPLVITEKGLLLSIYSE